MSAQPFSCKISSLFHVITIIVFTLSNLVSPTGMANAAPVSTGSISGTVFAADGVTVITDALISIHAHGITSGSSSLGTYVSQANGTYTISGLAPGTYKVQANNNRVSGYVTKYYNNQLAWNNADTIEVLAGQTTSGINFTLERGGSISGHVFKADGSTVVTDAQLYVGVETGTGVWASAPVSKTDGSYEITGVPTGNYRVIANYSNSLGYVREFYDNVYNWDRATPVAITGNNTVTGINFALNPGGGISGHVYASDGVTPVQGACVNISSTAPDFNQVLGWGSTGSDGSFSFGGVPLGNVNIRTHASCNGQNTGYIDEWYAAGGSVIDGKDATAVQIVSGQLTGNINFALDPGGSLSGVVRDTSNNPLSNVQICADDYDTDQNGNCVQSNASGFYTIGGVRTGDYRVQARVAGKAREYYNGTYNRNTATRVPVTAGTTTSNIDFVLEPGGTISGHIYQADGVTPIANMVVSLDGPGFGDGTCTDANGAYTFNSVAYGIAWRVHAAPEGNNWCGGSNSYASEYWQETQNWNSATTLTLSNGTPTYTGINFTLGAGGRVSGHVYGADGITPLAGVCVNVSSTAPNFNQVAGWGRTGADGSFSFSGVPVGNVYLRTDAGCGGQNSQYINEWYAAGGSVPNGNNATSVQVAAGQVTSNLDFSLDLGGSITGTIRDTSNNPIPNVQVCANDYDTDQNGNCVQSNTDGTYTIDGRLATDYRVQARASGWAREYYNGTYNRDAAARVPVTAGATTSNIDFVLEPGGTISGHVYQADGVTPIANMVVSLDGLNFGDGTCTDANGAYTFNSVAYGIAWRVRAAPGGNNWCGGSNSYASEYWQETSTWNSATTLTLSSGTTSYSGIDFTLELAGSISGYVRQADGVTPISGARVYAMDANFQSVNHDGYSTSDGSYQINGLLSGTYYLAVEATGYGGVYYDNGYDDPNAILVTVTVPVNTPNINFELSPEATTSGHVYQSDGTTPLAGAQVDVWPQNGGQIRQATTDTNGSYLISGLSTGSYVVRVKATGYAQEYYNNAGSWNTATPISVVQPNNTSGIDFTLELGGSLSGHVYEEDEITPLAGAQVHVWTVDGWYLTMVNASTDGSFVVDGLPSGSYIARAKAVGYGWEFYNGAYSFGTATPIPVTSSNNTSGIDFTVGLAGTISGVVYQADGTTPIANMAIYLALASNNAGPYRYTCSDASGHFTLDPVPYGAGWRVGAVPDVRCPGQPEGYVHEYWQDTHSWDAATVITLSQGVPNYTSVVFTLDQGETTSGVVGANGGSLETQAVGLNIPSGAISSDIPFTITDGGNNYQVTTNQGSLEVVVSAIIGPEGTSFNIPVTLTFHWPDDNSDGLVDGTNVNEGSLSLSKNGIVIAGPCSTDVALCNTTTNLFTVQVSSLSEFVIGAPASAPLITSITRVGNNPTSAASVDFTVTFSEPVSGVTPGDFTLTKTGTLSGESVMGVTGGPNIYTVSVNTGTGNGTIRLDIPANATITDLTGNPLASLPFTGGQVYTVARVYNLFLPLILR